MPIYEYKCNKCGGTFEVLVRASEKPACPQCGSKRLKKLVSGFSAPSGKSPCGRSKKSSRECAHGGGCCCGCHHS